MKKFIHQHIAELHNVTWPTQKQAIHAMVTVIVIMFITGLVLGAMDNVLSYLFSLIINL